MTVLLKDAIKPNLVQTLEGQPVLMHCGPFANIAHGNNSLIADLIGMKLGDYVVTESGFGADMGMEKFFDIVCRFGKLTPSAAVLVTTVRAIKHHGGARGRSARRALGGTPGDRDRHGQRPPPPEHDRARSACPRWSRSTGGPGTPTRRSSWSSASRSRRARSRPRPTRASPRAAPASPTSPQAVVEACEQPNTFHQLYQDDEPIQDKIEAVAKQVYGAKDVYFYPEAEAKLTQFTREGLGHFPVCMAKTHLSLSADPSLLNAPENFTLPVRDIRAYTGAGWLVPLCGDVMQMPGLGKTPGRAQHRHRRRGPHRRPFLSAHSASCSTPSRRGRPRPAAARARPAPARWRRRWSRWRRGSRRDREEPARRAARPASPGARAGGDRAARVRAGARGTAAAARGPRAAGARRGRPRQGLAVAARDRRRRGRAGRAGRGRSRAPETPTWPAMRSPARCWPRRPRRRPRGWWRST